MARRANTDDMVDAIREADKPLTEREIGERSGVTRPTVANHRDELQNHPEIAYGDVGKATAYWWNLENAQGQSNSKKETCARPGCHQEFYRSYEDGNGNEIPLCQECYCRCVTGLVSKTLTQPTGLRKGFSPAKEEPLQPDEVVSSAE